MTINGRHQQRSRLGIVGRATVHPPAPRPAVVRGRAAAAHAGRTFDVLAYTGGTLAIGGFDCPVVVDLATLDTSAQAIPALYDHIPDEAYIVGQVDRVTVENGAIKARGRFTPSGLPDDYSARVIARADAGYKWQASIGAEAASYERVQAGQTVVVNGRRFAGPVVIARGAWCRELSFVVMGADRLTSVTVSGVSGVAARRPAKPAPVAARGPRLVWGSFPLGVRSRKADRFSIDPAGRDWFIPFPLKVFNHSFAAIEAGKAAVELRVNHSRVSLASTADRSLKVYRYGAEVRWLVNTDTVRGRDAAKYVQANAHRFPECSPGTTTFVSFDPAADTIRVETADLHEISLVTRGALPGTRVFVL